MNYEGLFAWFCTHRLGRAKSERQSLLAVPSGHVYGRGQCSFDVLSRCPCGVELRRFLRIVLPSDVVPVFLADATQGTPLRPKCDPPGFKPGLTISRAVSHTRFLWYVCSGFHDTLLQINMDYFFGTVSDLSQQWAYSFLEEVTAGAWGFAIDLLILFSCSVVSLWNWLEAEIPLTRRFEPTAEQ